MSTNGSLKRPREGDEDNGSQGSRPATMARMEGGSVPTVGNNGSGQNMPTNQGNSMISFPQVGMGMQQYPTHMNEILRHQAMLMHQRMGMGMQMPGQEQMKPQMQQQRPNEQSQQQMNPEYAQGKGGNSGPMRTQKVEESSAPPSDGEKMKAHPQPKSKSLAPKVEPTQRSSTSNVSYNHIQSANPPVAPGDANKQNTLKVEDALSYLDKVRLKFEKQPQVYNDFLDIMKEFKSSNIDTPGVIERVSELFKGHSVLIKGFNTFLPLGYKIEINDDDRIIVHITENKPGPPQQQHHQQPPQQMPPKSGRQPQIHPAQMQAQHQMGGPRGVMQPQMVMHPGQVPPPVVGGKGPLPVQYQQMAGPQGAGHKTPMEFDHAINYVNKIKKRFQNDTVVYKEFLDILHAYQEKKLDIEVVYKQVALLFRDHQDLLEEFSQFLPDATHHHMAAKQTQQDAQRQFESTKKQRAGGKQKQQHDMKIATQKKTPKEKDLTQGQLEELAYFDKVKKALKNPKVYEQFLRCLNLYSHEIINRTELVELVSNFLVNHKNLFDWFKRFVGVKDRQSVEHANQAKAAVDQAPELDLRMCEPQDKSYRALPETHRHRLCSGRKDLDPEIAAVLNDKWVSFPTWSEEASFQATKKNHHEEAIFRCEDERFELDIIIEANLATIRNLDMVVKTLEEMTPEQKVGYKFNTKTLGGASEVIHRKSVQRLYGDRTEEVFLAMQRDPLNNIPIVLRRLKQKNLEWRNTQRQWNAIWREHNEKNYLRSLDYQGANFKRTDPLAFKAKALRETMQDMREKYREYVLKQREGSTPEGEAPKPPVISFCYSDPEILQALNRLVMYVAKRGNTNTTELAQIQSVLESFTPLMLSLPIAEQLSSATFIPKAEDGEDEDKEKEDEIEESTKEKQSGDKTDSDAAPMEVDGETKGDEKSDTTDEAKKEASSAGEVPNSYVDQPVFYANRHWFVYLKLHQIVYERLLEIKNMSDGIAKKHAARAASGKGPSAAITLSLRTPLEFAQDGYFDAFLSTTEKFVNGDIDAAIFEETTREMFNTTAYKVFTIDRLLNAIQKKLQQCISEPLTRSLAGLYLRSREGAPGLDYKKEAFESLGVGSDRMNIYKIEDKGNQKLDMELLDFELLTDEEGEDVEAEDAGPTLEEKWADYVGTYVKMESTDERIQQLAKNPTFIFNQKDGKELSIENTEILDELTCKVCCDTYKMYYVTTDDSKDDAESQTNGNKIGKLKTFLSSWARDHRGSTDCPCQMWTQGPPQVSADTEASA